MKYTQARQGRVFILRLEDGEIVHEVIEQFAADEKIAAAALIILGGGGTFGDKTTAARLEEPAENAVLPENIQANEYQHGGAQNFGHGAHP